MNETIDIPQHFIEEVSKQKKYIEWTVGYTEYVWTYYRYRYNGWCRVPVPFNTLDETVCGMLACKPMNQSALSAALGLNVDENKAAAQVLDNVLCDLRSREVITQSEQVWSLTDYGHDCLKRQAKPERFNKQFELYINATGQPIKKAHKAFAALDGRVVETNQGTWNRWSWKDYVSNHPALKEEYTLEQICKMAAVQAPEVHAPKKDYILLDCRRPAIGVYEAKVWVALFNNFRDKTLRAIVADTKTGNVLPELSQALSDDEDLMHKVLRKMVEEDESSRGKRIEYERYENKPQQQRDVERTLIDLQDKLDAAVTDNNSTKQQKIEKQLQDEQRYYDAQEFEQELRRLFDTTRGEMWLVSPWIKKAAERLLPYIEAYLKKGGKVFIGYSCPENRFSVMYGDEQMAAMMELDRKYPNFYICELACFHDKHLFLRGVKRPLHYTGSYNILSFNAGYYESWGVKQREYGIVRRETMVKNDWTDEVQTKVFEPIQQQFACYCKKLNQELK